MELTGKIKVIFDAKRVSASFTKREVVLVTPGRYPQPIMLEFTQDKVSLLDNFSAGDEVRVQIDIRGREWTSPRGEVKYFVSIQGWRIEPLQQQAYNGPPGPGAGPAPGPGYGPAPASASGSGSGPAGGPPPFDDIPPPDSEYGGVRRPDDDIPF